MPVGAIINTVGGMIGNKKNRQYADKTYEKTRRDNLADWHRNNTYNSPQEQMKRFQEAGLNKNLMYGQGNSGPSGNIPTADAPTPEFNTPDASNLDNIFGGIADLRLKKQQTDNLKKQADEITARTALTQAQEIQTLTNTADTEQNIQFKKDAIDDVTRKRKLDIEKVYYDIDNLHARQARNQRIETSNEKTAVLQRKLLQNQDAMKEYEVLVAKAKARGLKISMKAINSLLKKFKLK